MDGRANERKRQKATLRKKVLQLKDELSTEEWESRSASIHKQLFHSKEWNQAKVVAVYYSVKKEVDTLQIIKQGMIEGKKIALPKCDPSKKQLQFYTIDSLDHLEVVYYGIPEPIRSKCEPIQGEQLELMIVPGVVFATSGYRIGYGAGYYDRYLEEHQDAFQTTGLAFECQLVPESNLPIESFDVPVDMLITEKQTVHCIQRRKSSKMKTE